MKEVESLLRVRSDHPEYLQMAADEARFWQNMHPWGLESLEQKYDEGPIDRYTNRRFTGDEKLSWERTIARHGRFQRGAALGTGSLRTEAAILETNPSLHLTFIDIAEGAVLRRREVLGARFPGRIDIQIADLNFLELPPARYDLIVSSSTIHHVTNLEYLANEINASLTDDGYFFLHDYVGEPRFGFSAEKKNLYRAIFNRDTERQGRGRPDLIWLDSSDLSPFCGVRSDEILETFRDFLAEVEVHTADTLITPINRSRPAQDFADSPWVSDEWMNRASYLRRLWHYVRGSFPQLFGKLNSPQNMLSEEFLNELFLVGDSAAAANLLRPSLAFAIYRKRAATNSP